MIKLTMRVATLATILGALAIGCYAEPHTGESAAAGDCVDVDGDKFPKARCDTDDNGVIDDADEPVDCNDTDANINPDASEVCNQIDDDCDGQVDEGNVCDSATANDCDGDNDGHNRPSCDGDNDGDIDTQDTPNGADCNDGNVNVHPGAVEICNQIDDDCDGMIDEGGVCGTGNTCSDAGQPCSTGLPGVCGSGVKVCQNGVSVCQPFASAQAEKCDGLDNDCDGQVDDGVCGQVDNDLDNDGHDAGPDCNDNNGGVHPGAAEICGNGIDENCDGSDLACNPGGPAQQRKVYVHWKVGVGTTQIAQTSISNGDWDMPVWTKMNQYGGPVVGSEYQECLMNLWGAEGNNEVYICYFFVPVGATMESWSETIKPGAQTSIFLQDVCDYPGSTCQGQGDFCKPHYVGESLWFTYDAVDGPVVDPQWADNADGEGTCSSNAKIVVQAP